MSGNLHGANGVSSQAGSLAFRAGSAMRWLLAEAPQPTAGYVRSSTLRTAVQERREAVGEGFDLARKDVAESWAALLDGGFERARKYMAEVMRIALSSDPALQAEVTTFLMSSQNARMLAKAMSHEFFTAFAEFWRTETSNQSEVDAQVSRLRSTADRMEDHLLAAFGSDATPARSAGTGPDLGMQGRFELGMFSREVI